MSFEVSNFYWDRCTDVKGSERLVILALADYCNEWGCCFPSVPELARRCRLSDRGIQKILARLAAGGHIAVAAKEGMRKTRGSPTHKYHLLAYQRTLTGAKGEQLRSPIAVDKGERIDSPLAAEKGEQIARKDEQIDSPLAAEKGEQIARKDEQTDSPLAVDKGEQMAQKGEQIDAKGEPVRSPEPYRSINDPNTNSATRARGRRRRHPLAIRRWSRPITTRSAC